MASMVKQKAQALFSAGTSEYLEIVPATLAEVIQKQQHATAAE